MHLVPSMFSLCCWLFWCPYEASGSSPPAGCNRNRPNEEEQPVFARSVPPVIEPTNASEILKNLFIGYDKRLRAGYGEKPLMISVSLGFLSISKVVEENMEFTADIYMRQIWNDTRLAFANRSSALVLQHEAPDKLWLPDTFIENAVKLTVEKETRTVLLYGDGLIVFSQKITVTAMTPMDFHAYPMDKQALTLDFISYARDKNQIQYRWSKVHLLNEKMSEFVIMRQEAEASEKRNFIGCFDFLTVKFHVKRRVVYYVIRIYFPCIICAVVSWMAFWMNCDAIGDRGTVGITSLLSQVFLLGSINECMPRVSYIKAADQFLMVSFGFTFMALLESLLVYSVATRDKVAEEGTPLSGKDKKAKLPLTITKMKRLDADGTEFSHDDTDERENDRIHDSRGMMGHKTSSAILAIGNIENVGKLIDTTAKVLFPLGYTVFTVIYFMVYMS